MATKKEIWYNYNDGECASEFDALTDDISFGEDARHACKTGELSPRVVAVIDALHEYAHRGDKAPSDVKVKTGIKLRVGGVYKNRRGGRIEIRRALVRGQDEYEIDDCGYAFEGVDDNGDEYYYTATGAFDPDGEDTEDLVSEVIEEVPATTLPEGVPPELDDWVKRWEWITAKVSVDAIRELRKGDEVRIGRDWYHVDRADDCTTMLELHEDGLTTYFYVQELANIANEVRYNGR
jgi:hypothetical protein